MQTIAAPGVSNIFKLAQPNRRTFLKTSTLTLAAAALPTWGYAAGTPKKIRLGIVGGGFGADFHWHEHPDCVVQAVSDLRDDRREKLMKTYRCAVSYPSLKELVKAPDIDAVAIFTEAPAHVKHVIEAMKHGKHVISAVPAAWATMEDAERLLAVVKKTGLTYMMAETGYYQESTQTARRFFQTGKFGKLFYCEAEYLHPGREADLYHDGKPTWRYGLPPMHYPTHTLAQWGGVTGDPLTEVTCNGWGDDHHILKDNAYQNPFWNESALFRTKGGLSFRANVMWKGAFKGCERAQWIGDKMSFYSGHPNGVGPVIIRESEKMEEDAGGFSRLAPAFENYSSPPAWQTEALPEPLRHPSGHEGSHVFITHEFIDALIRNRRPTVDVYEALAYTIPGIIAHQSALQSGKQLKVPQFARPV